MRAPLSDRGAMLGSGLGVSQCVLQSGPRGVQRVGRALSLNGINNKITASVADRDKLGVNDWALECWFLHRTLNGVWPGLISTSRVVGGYPAGDVPLMTIRNATTQFGINRVGIADTGVFVELGADHYNKWVFGVVTRIGPTVFVYAWKDRALIQASGPAVGGALNLVNNSASIVLGLHWETSSVAYFDGVIDAVRIYSGRGLSLDEADQHYRGSKIDRRCLVAQYDLDEPDGLIAYDKSGYGNHGTLVGAPQRVQVFRPDRLPT